MNSIYTIHNSVTQFNVWPTYSERGDYFIYGLYVEYIQEYQQPFLDFGACCIANTVMAQKRHGPSFISIGV